MRNSSMNLARSGSSMRWPTLVTLVIALAILWGTLSPPAQGGGALPLTDKQLHALGFALLIFPMALASPKRALKLAPLYVAFGAAIEMVQPAVGRTAEWGDLIADVIGVAAGINVALVLRLVTRRG